MRLISDPFNTMNQPIEGADEINLKAVPDLELNGARPLTPRSITAPEITNTLSSSKALSSTTLTLRPRNSSPYRKYHLRSKSSAGSLSAPQMTRAHSSPGPDTTGQFITPTSIRPSSPLGPPGRRRSPLRRSSDEIYLSFGGQVDIGETISENSELELTPRQTTDGDNIPNSPVFANHNTFPRVRRRSSSPFRQPLTSTTRNGTSTSILRTSTSSPSLSAAKFNEPYPSSYSFSSSSVPSTPTSFRSRSPSISSLETIPDSPDAELAAEKIAILKAAADNENNSEGEEFIRRRGSMDAMVRPGIMRDKRKRWSVCGAERRGDLDLETIWED